MIPKEKAIDLIYKFSCKVAGHSAVKQCAKIAVEEIINNSVLNYSGSDFSDNEIMSDTEYWNEVLKEIESL